MFLQLLGSSYVRLLGGILSGIVGTSVDPDQRRNTARSLVGGTWASRVDDWPDFWRETKQRLGESTLAAVDRMATSPEDLPYLKEFLEAVWRQTPDELNQTTVDAMVRRVSLAEAVWHSEVPVYRLVSAASQLPSAPTSREMLSLNDPVKFGLLMEAASRPPGSGLYPFLLRAMTDAETSAEHVERVERAAMHLGEHQDLSLDPAGWTLENPQRPEPLSSVIAIIFRTQAPDDPSRHVEPLQVPCEVKILCEFEGNGVFLTPELGPRSQPPQEGHQVFTYIAPSLLEESLKAIREWLQYRLEDTFDWIARNTRSTPRVEFFLPLDILHLPVHAWEYGPAEAPEPLGTDFHTVVRAGDRYRRGSTLMKLQDRLRAEFQVCWCPLPFDANEESSLNVSLRADPCIAFEHGLQIDIDRGTLRYLINAGTPYLVWMMGEGADARECVKERLDPCLQSVADAIKLLDSIKNERLRLGKSNARRLALVYEFPTMTSLPPDVSPFDVLRLQNS